MPVSFLRITAGQFLEKLKNTSPEWFGEISGVDGLVMYADGKNTYGPDPFDTPLSLPEYQAFVEEALRLLMIPVEERKNCELRVNFP